MEQKGMTMGRFDGTLTYHVWVLACTEEWGHLCKDPLTDMEETLFSNEDLWPNSSCIESNNYATCYNPETGSQLFEFATEVPESTLVRACIHSGRTLSEFECNYFVLQVHNLLLQQTFERYWQENDAWLDGLHSLTSMLELDELLHNIMHNVLIAIPSVDRGFLMLYDVETQKLTPKASVGLGSSIYDFKTDLGEGIGGKVYQDGVGRIFNPEQGLEAISNIQANNMKSLMAALGNTNINSNIFAMAVPVRMNEEKIGVMIVHQITKKRKLTNADLRRLQGFADQAAIAITNARLFSDLRETNEYLVKRNHIHEVFTKLSLKDSDLIMVAKTVERMINLPVSLFDITKNEWYPHYTPLSKKLMDTDLLNGWENSLDSLTVTTNETPVHLYPIVNEGVPIGYFVVELKRLLRPLDTVVLEQGSAVVALKMVNTYSMTDMYYKQCYEFFNELLQYKEPNLLASKSSDFGLSPDKLFFVTVMQLSGRAQVVKKQETYQRKLIAALHNELVSLQYLLFGFQDKVTIIMNATSESQQEVVIRKLKKVVNSWTNKDAPVLMGGIGTPYPGLENVARSFEEANKSLAYILNRGTPDIISYESIGINRLFINQQAEDIKPFIQDVFEPLQSPKAQSSDLELTLRTYIDANRSIPETSARLHIHQNTLYHRIRKIEEILAVNLNDSSDWLKLLLACHLSDLY
ncbi:helix-turn-helix domain-containing protein [Bacillus sp. ISL-40]|uniref:helix-turn-helix domain-containing protein n=1 Tax=unclassified Bacillus (in: firmicutes) TaxID=185979 RepID=UPI001BE5707A|nr:MULTISPECIES: helix-turn-helix domain-containing protein [unclassified Bacillus (in: firmicutes)]MBT2696512.1 helix-turn-helix domain-containing protein [Bacillus sp. ISL-40]MBT2743734.1 helix-turn-helix domain-containing protein [Bacillus sp. ISL-77]